MSKEVLTVEEAADFLQISVWTVREKGRGKGVGEAVAATRKGEGVSEPHEKAEQDLRRATEAEIMLTEQHYVRLAAMRDAATAGDQSAVERLRDTRERLLNARMTREQCRIVYERQLNEFFDGGKQ